jgi:predicted Fe-S protein YdhL (DUF1289 family)
MAERKKHTCQKHDGKLCEACAGTLSEKSNTDLLEQTAQQLVIRNQFLKELPERLKKLLEPGAINQAGELEKLYLEAQALSEHWSFKSVLL